jgi:hypothetical protein
MAQLSNYLPTWLTEIQDEIDSIAPRRSSGDDLIARRVLTELLIQMSNIADDHLVFVFAATNRLEVLKPGYACTVLVPHLYETQMPIPVWQHMLSSMLI